MCFCISLYLMHSFTGSKEWGNSSHHLVISLHCCNTYRIDSIWLLFKHSSCRRSRIENIKVVHILVYLHRLDIVLRSNGKSDRFQKQHGPFPGFDLLSANGGRCRVVLSYMFSLFASRVSSESTSHTRAVKWRLHWRSRELIATGEGWKRT
jgi:hypothetical protein